MQTLENDNFHVRCLRNEIFTAKPLTNFDQFLDQNAIGFGKFVKPTIFKADETPLFHIFHEIRGSLYQCIIKKIRVFKLNKIFVNTINFRL